MIDVKETIQANLRTSGLFVYPERFVNSETPVPCITWTLYDNSTDKNGDSFGYSNIIFKVTVWGKTEQDLEKYGIKVDNIMRELGFKRTNVTELWQDSIGQKTLRFEALAIEAF